MKFENIRATAIFILQRPFARFEVPPEPFMDPESAARFNDELEAAKLYLEFGSGGSTMAATRVGVPTVSVENDPKFAAAVKKAAGRNVTLLAVDTGVTGATGFPLFRRPSSARIARWRRYVEAPFSILDERFPDLILVDGRWRVACALEAARRAKLAGEAPLIMVDDYRGRAHYAVIETHLGRPEMVGRSAWFRISDQTPSVPISAVEDALLDPR